MNKVSVPIKELKHFIGCEMIVEGEGRCRLIGIRNDVVIYEDKKKCGSDAFGYTTVEFIKPIVKSLNKPAEDDFIQKVVDMKARHASLFHFSISSIRYEFEKTILAMENDIDVFDWIGRNMAIDKELADRQTIYG